MNSIQLPNVGYIIDNVPYPLIDELKEIIKEKELEKHNSKLAGNIKKEFLIPKAIPVFNRYIFELVAHYENSFNFLQSMNQCNADVPLSLDSMWVNFQEKHEFNPPHTHGGVYSFALWLKVPYLIEDELKQGPGSESNNNIPGHFQFMYINSLGAICTEKLPVDKSWEGKIAFFPAKLNHQVLPFYTSDDYRISVSGNVCIDTKSLGAIKND